MYELEDKAKKLLEGRNLVLLAMLDKKGSPHLTRKRVGTDGERVEYRGRALGERMVILVIRPSKIYP
ncbi:MAG: hypothetical protein OK455_05150 [Thaumarchaeota archaeon]|nr:hypothetical protein [Nitrososphaerota archaeon]